ncbi:hypothetical protein B0H14DRAFT_2646511 [Mycena olivaceomarginata]|nr:hypothetical protein B0H14DRAFT_2646511 [Mycena olivaceomarginata]
MHWNGGETDEAYISRSATQFWLGFIGRRGLGSSRDTTYTAASMMVGGFGFGFEPGSLRPGITHWWRGWFAEPDSLRHGDTFGAKPGSLVGESIWFLFFGQLTIFFQSQALFHTGVLMSRIPLDNADTYGGEAGLLAGGASLR